ncbi:hypothetical protein BD413DRAFT_208721 [Trametes elegans]|nr:hypothetical protein BD413DRAFT_208721 [Trametes elegans]
MDVGCYLTCPTASRTRARAPLPLVLVHIRTISPSFPNEPSLSSSLPSVASSIYHDPYHTVLAHRTAPHSAHCLPIAQSAPVSDMVYLLAYVHAHTAFADHNTNKNIYTTSTGTVTISTAHRHCLVLYTRTPRHSHRFVHPLSHTPGLITSPTQRMVKWHAHSHSVYPPRLVSGHFFISITQCRPYVRIASRILMQHS